MYYHNNFQNVKSLSIWKGIFLLLFFYQNVVTAQCTNAAYGQLPALNVTPNCDGVLQTITTVAKAGEYSNVVVFSNINYTFSSSRTADYITITNEDASVVLAHGITPISWNSNAYSGIIRYYLHNNSSCQISTTARTKYINCNAAGQTLCYEPQALAVGNITIDSALFYWDNVSPYPNQGYHYYISEDSTLPDADTVPTGIHFFDNVTLENLKSNTTYYCWVRSSCFYDLHTEWKGISFTTLAGCNLPSASLFPSSTFTPTCTGNYQLITNNCYAGEYSNVSVSGNRLYTFASSNTNDYITITNPSGSIVYKTGTTPLDWLSGSVSGTIRFYIHKYNNCTTENVSRSRYVKCSAISQTCQSPTSIIVNNITSQQAEISWNLPSPLPAEGYEIYRSTTNTAPTLFSSPIFKSSDLNYTLTNLNSNTTYYTWVRSVCDNGNKSSWYQGPTFSTLSSYVCLAPQNIFTELVTNYKAKINWTISGIFPNDGFDYYLSTLNISPTASTTPTGSTYESTHVFNNLIENTTYYLWIRSKCSGTNKSLWASHIFTTAAIPLGCNSGGTFTSEEFFTNYNCDGNEYVITTNNYAGSYRKIIVNPFKHFTFRSTTNTDFLTVTNEDNSVIYVSGNTPIQWNSSSVVEIIRLYVHTDTSCGTQNVNRTTTIICDGNLYLSSNDFSIKNIDFKVYPNPTYSILTIESELGEFNYIIYSIEGKIVKQGNCFDSKISIEVSNLNTGIYLVELESNGTKSIQKIIKH